MIGYITSTLVFYFSCLFFCAIPQESYVHFFFQVEDCVVNVHVTGSVSFFKLIFHAHLKLVKKKACLFRHVFLHTELTTLQSTSSTGHDA